jgi:hypothetical protein
MIEEVCDISLLGILQNAEPDFRILQSNLCNVRIQTTNACLGAFVTACNGIAVL